jgi:hypothetical protein
MENKNVDWRRESLKLEEREKLGSSLIGFKL